MLDIPASAIAPCYGKVRHVTRGDAVKAITKRRLSQHSFGNRKVQPYRCANCNGWHVGHGVVR